MLKNINILTPANKKLFTSISALFKTPKCTFMNEIVENFNIQEHESRINNNTYTSQYAIKL